MSCIKMRRPSAALAYTTCSLSVGQGAPPRASPDAICAVMRHRDDQGTSGSNLMCTDKHNTFQQKLTAELEAYR